MRIDSRAHWQRTLSVKKTMSQAEQAASHRTVNYRSRALDKSFVERQKLAQATIAEHTTDERMRTSKSVLYLRSRVNPLQARDKIIMLRGSTKFLAFPEERYKTSNVSTLQQFHVQPPVKKNHRYDEKRMS